MNLDQLKTQLMAAARAVPPNELVPYAFEKRVMARLVPGSSLDLLGAWSTALWRAAVGCVALVALSGLVTLWSSQSPVEDLSQEFETAVFASAGSADEAW
jgi:hypothetical protein